LPGRTDPEALVEIPTWRWNREANGIRLPTEAEWEFACRANAETDYHFGNDERLVPLYINVSNFRRKPLVPGGSLLPNRFGLYEMHGNVWEWCFDWYSAMEPSPMVDPQGPSAFIPEMAGKVYRGGGVAQSSGDPGSGARGRALPNSRFGNLGFRIAR
jgi:formylglycine-generating enzyme required for sulfatase activity